MARRFRTCLGSTRGGAEPRRGRAVHDEGRLDDPRAARPTDVDRVQNQSLAEATLEPGQATTRHYHSESEEIYLLLAGGGVMEIDGETREVGPGDAVLISPGARHTLRAGAEGARLLCCCAPPYRHDDTFFD